MGGQHEHPLGRHLPLLEQPALDRLGALLLAQPEAKTNPFFMLIPAQWGDAPQFALVGMATAATVIASQALITGAFSITKQVVQLGYLPRMRVIYTNVRELGQIYMPFVNWTLFAAIALVAHAAGVASPRVALGAQVFFWARVVYIPVYYAGIVYLRTAVWTVGIIGLAMMISAML